MPHPLYTVLAAVFVAAAMSMAEDRSPRERLQAAARTFACCIASVVAGGWLMHCIVGRAILSAASF